MKRLKARHGMGCSHSKFQGSVCFMTAQPPAVVSPGCLKGSGARRAVEIPPESPTGRAPARREMTHGDTRDRLRPG